jgi:hypothetical protein
MFAAAENGEQVKTFTEAAGLLERKFGRRPNAATIYRWATKGVKGVRLDTIALGRYRYTTESALERFVAETSRTDAGRNPVAESSASPAVTNTNSGFSKAELAAAKRRRQQEKAKAIEFLQSRLGPADRATNATSTADTVQEVPQS